MAGMGSSAIAEMVPQSAAALHQTQQKWHEGDGHCFKQMKHLPLLPHHLPVSSCLILVPTGLKHGCSQHKWRQLELMGCSSSTSETAAKSPLALQNAGRVPAGSDVSTWRPPQRPGWPASPTGWGQPCVALHAVGTAFLALACVSRQDMTLRTRKKKCPLFFFR